MAVVRHRFFTATSAASLLLCIATAAVWTWSYWAEEYFQRTGAGGGYELTCSKGRIWAEWCSEPLALDSGGWGHARMRPPIDFELPAPQPSLTVDNHVPYYRLYANHFGFVALTYGDSWSDRREHLVALPLVCGVGFGRVPSVQDRAMPPASPRTRIMPPVRV